jgi:hypothetical protein
LGRGARGRSFPHPETDHSKLPPFRSSATCPNSSFVASTRTMSKIPPIEQLSRPEPLHKVLAEQDKLQDDCMPCRVTGKLIVLL